MKKKPDKTNVMRVLDRAGVPYRGYEFIADGTFTGMDVAALIGRPPEQVFKTLVTTGASGAHYVYMVPVCAELDLKKAARAVGEKSIAMLSMKELLPLTGYIHGGCSPIGMKKQFVTTIHDTAEGFDTILFSAGKIGRQVELSLSSLRQVVPVQAAVIICEEGHHDR